MVLSIMLCMSSIGGQNHSTTCLFGLDRCNNLLGELNHLLVQHAQFMIISTFVRTLGDVKFRRHRYIVSGTHQFIQL